jgi:ankyrin repeat protein
MVRNYQARTGTLSVPAEEVKLAKPKHNTNNRMSQKTEEKNWNKWMEYDWIMDSLRDGTVDDWEEIAQHVSDFPSGRDDFINRHWITNAIDCGSLESVKWMISKCVNLRFVDNGGYSPLHSCIDRTLPNKHEILQLLIDSGADINIGTELKTQGWNGWTPLHMAAVRNDIEAVKILLDSGADCSLTTPIDEYTTAAQEATLRGHHEVEKLIRAYKVQQQTRKIEKNSLKEKRKQ